MTVVVVATPEDMAALGARVASLLRAGDVVALDGELGAGKTTFTRGLGDALGVRGTVTSPTFVLARTHQRRNDGSGDAPLVHVDAYRLGDAAELDDLDIDLASSITVVEWAGALIEGLTDSVLSIRIDRPTGAASSAVFQFSDVPNPGGSNGSGESGGSGGSNGSSEGGESGESGGSGGSGGPGESYDLEPVEPRTVAVIARGPAWEDRTAQVADLGGA